MSVGGDYLVANRMMCDEIMRPTSYDDEELINLLPKMSK
jgi:hypothetical protein